MGKLENLGKEELIELLINASKNWLAHDGVWFQAVEKAHGMNAAIAADKAAWEKFTVIEAKRIMKFLKIEPGGGIPALIKALDFRLYAHINRQEVAEVSENRCVFRMNDCRVQSARTRKGLPDFPCKPVGLVEYEYFAKTIDTRIETRCIACPPDPHPDEYYCAWEFTIKG